MVTELKSILRRIPWSLALKAFAVSLSWLFLPYWIFLLTALYVYFVPFFQVARLGLPFALTLIATLFLPKTVVVSETQVPNFFAALVLFLIFFLILGVKDLILVHRARAYEFIILLLLFLNLLHFFAVTPSWNSFSLTVGLVWLGAISFLLLRDLFRYQKLFLSDRERTASSALFTLFVLEGALTSFFLPLPFFSQAAFLFVGLSLLYEVLIENEKGVLSLKRALGYAAAFGAFTLLVVLFQ